MLRSKPAALFAAALAAVVCAKPVAAQFGSIFNDPPPRPPANVGPPADDDRYYQTRPQPVWPRDPQVVAPPPPAPYPQQQNYPQDQQQALPPPPGAPQQALPRPPGAPLPPGVEQQTLAPPPGATNAPPGATPNPLPGLPPGQRQPRGSPTDTALSPGEEVVVPPPAQKIVNGTAVFSGLDKITGRIISFDVAIGETVQFGALQVTPRACYTRPPTETPNTDAFVEVDEITLQNEIKRIFTGWMFASSPGLHAVEHAIYDVWLVDCKAPQAPAVAADATPPGAKPAQPQPQQKAAPPRPRQPAAPPPPLQPGQPLPAPR